VKRLSENNAENSTWCKNPQIFLNLIKPTHVKIILKKTGKNKKNKAIPVGLVIAKAILGTKGLIKPPNSKNFKGAKNTLNNQQNVGEVPPLSKIDRKLRLLHNEWFKETSYQHEDIGAFYTFWQTNEGPFLIVPTLSKPDITAGFVLTLYTSNMIELVKLDDAKNKVITDQWTKESSGGCHLNSDPYEMKDNATWKNNPKFNLIMKGDTQSKVKISLSRPEKTWVHLTDKNSVGCMIGMYIFENIKIYDVKPSSCLNKIEFVPMHDLTVYLDLQPLPHGYIIMPATFEKGKIGPFMISVSSNDDFVFKHYQME